MRSWSTTVGPKGQITLPVEVRRALGLRPKDAVTVTMDGHEVRIESVRARLRASVLDYPPGELPTPMTWAEVKASAREDMARDIWEELHRPEPVSTGS